MIFDVEYSEQPVSPVATFDPSFDFLRAVVDILEKNADILGAECSSSEIVFYLANINTFSLYENKTPVVTLQPFFVEGSKAVSFLCSMRDPYVLERMVVQNSYKFHPKPEPHIKEFNQKNDLFEVNFSDKKLFVDHLALKEELTHYLHACVNERIHPEVDEYGIFHLHRYALLISEAMCGLEQNNSKMEWIAGVKKTNSKYRLYRIGKIYQNKPIPEMKKVHRDNVYEEAGKAIIIPFGILMYQWKKEGVIRKEEHDKLLHDFNYALARIDPHNRSDHFPEQLYCGILQIHSPETVKYFNI